MKVVVINNSGNVGKSFLSRELFYPHMKNGMIIEVETHNSSSEKFNVETIKIKGSEFDKLFPLMYKYDDFVVDVGASQVIPFLNELSKSPNVLDDLDYIILPVTNNGKVQEDTVKTIMLLENLNLQDKVNVILNRADNLEQFDVFFELVEHNTNININKNLRIFEYDVINKLEKTEKCAWELANDDTDFKKLAQEAFKNSNDEEGTTLAELDYIKKFSVGINKNMDTVYALLLATK